MTIKQRPLNVYGCNLDGRYRGIVAARTKSEAARRLGVSYSQFGKFGCATANAEEIELAMREPGAAWKLPYSIRHGDQWQPIEPLPNQETHNDR